jgi:glycosyltransferase involved in cell wall biosynthesis
MSKILYIGNYLDSTSWGKLCRDYLTAMAQEGLDVVARPYIHTIGNQVITNSPLIQALEDKDSEGAEICVQQVPINDAIIDRRFKKNVFIFGDLKYKWRQSELATLSRFRDCAVLAMNKSTLNAFSYSQVPQNIVLQPVSYPDSVVKEAFEANVPKLEFLADKPTYKFYTIGKVSGRKNIRKLLQAYYLEFDKDENVDLVIKVTTDIDPEEAGKIVGAQFESVLNELGKYPSINDYRPPAIITGWAEDENLVQLHKSCDCFVSASWAEHQNYFVNHARLAGNQAISKDVHDDLGPERLILELNPINLSPYQYNKTEMVCDVDLAELMHLMRYAYTNYNAFTKQDITTQFDFIKVLKTVI